MPVEPVPSSVNTQWANVQAALDTDLGPGISMAISKGFQHLGLGQLDAFYQRGHGKFNLPLGTLAGAKFAERILPAGDREILKDDILKTCDLLYKKSDRNIIWVETSGQTDLSNILKSHLPCPLELTGKVSFKRIEPYESPSGVLPKGVSFGHTLQIPHNAALAQKMPPGARFELAGESRANLKSDTSLGIQGSRKCSILLSVQRLPQPDKVIVKLVRSYGSEGSFGYHYLTDLKQSLGAIGQYLSERTGFGHLLQSTAAHAEAKRTHNEREIKEYALDLSIPEQAQAYDQLIQQLSTDPAESVAQNQGGVEDEVVHAFNATASLGETNLTLYHISETEKNTYLNSKYYQATKSIYEHVSKWFSKFSVIWEWVALKDTTKQTTQSYCHLTFNSPYANDFFDVTDSLQIPMVKEAREILSTCPKTDFHADIFFTDTGIKNIQASSFEQAFESYLGVPISPEIKRYGEIQNKWFFTRWFFRGERKRLEKQNPWLQDNASLITAAYAFAKKTQPFKGSLRRFSDMKSVVSLMKLAKPEETIIHELSLTGPGIVLSNPDEGEISQPR